MPRKKKAKTKKELKKSVNRLYKALMKEKEKHRKASKMVGYMTTTTRELVDSNNKWKEAYADLNQAYDEVLTKHEIVLDTSAELLKRFKQED